MHTIWWWILGAVAFVAVWRLSRRVDSAAEREVKRFMDEQVRLAGIRPGEAGQVMLDVTATPGEGTAEVVAIVQHRGTTTRSARTVRWDDLPAELRAELLRTGDQHLTKPWPMGPEDGGRGA